MQGAARKSKSTHTERNAKRAVRTFLPLAVLRGAVWSPRPIASSVRGAVLSLIQQIVSRGQCRHSGS